MRTVGVLFAGLCGVALFAPEQPALARHHASHHAAPARQAAKQNPGLNQTVMDAEVLLDRAGASPGVIDGRDGDNFENALQVFQQASGLPVGRLDQPTMARLEQASNGPVLTQYTIQPDDVNGPFTPQIPTDFRKMAELQHLGYGSPRELLAE